MEPVDFVKHNCLEENVHFPGIVTEEDKLKFLGETDIFAFPSWYPSEGPPLVILEAMSSGCPVISTKGVGVIDGLV